jgi:hypothetical protein
MNKPPGESLIMQVLSEFGYTGSQEEVAIELRALLAPRHAKPRTANIGYLPPDGSTGEN